VSGAPGQELVRFDRVALTFPGGSGRSPVEVIRELDLDVQASEFVAIIGPSGCGKSTLLLLLAGYLAPSSGQVRFRGKPISGPGRERMMVFQQPALFPWLTTAENVAYGLKLKANRGDGRNVKETVAAMLQLVQLEGFARHYPSDLSGGMRQRLEIARALAVDPQVLLMGEPLAALDALTRRTMQREVLHIWEKRVRRSCSSPMTSTRRLSWPTASWSWRKDRHLSLRSKRSGFPAPVFAKIRRSASSPDAYQRFSNEGRGATAVGRSPDWAIDCARNLGVGGAF